MAPRTASPASADPDAIEFVRFCYRRRRVGWPELYDEMCAVAARGLYRGMGADELAGIGIGLALFDMPGLAGLAATVVAEEQARRRPVAVAIVPDPPSAVAIVPDPPSAVAIVPDPPTPESAASPASGVEVMVVGEAGVDVVPVPVTVAASATDVEGEMVAPDDRSERAPEVGFRLAVARAGV